jgi:CelD/BcsL family acetyltransferase involved in cellulose biosynthesis
VAELSALGAPVRFRVRDAQPVPEHAAVARTGSQLWHGIDLERGVDAVRATFAPAARRGIRHAREGGVRTDPLADAQLGDFVALHVGVRKHKYGLLAQPRTFFEALRSNFSAVDGWYPIAAIHQGRVVAVTVYLRWRDTLYYKFNASLPDALPLRPNNLLVDAGIELACALGCRHFDFGATDEDQPGLARFKRQFGADERRITALEIGTPSVAPDSEAWRVLSSLQAIFCGDSVPDATTARAGELLYRYFA